MKVHHICGLLFFATVLTQTPAWADDLVFSANPKNSFEAGNEGDGTFLHAITDSSRQIGELASWKPGADYRGKRVRFTTRLKTAQATRATCSLAAWNDTRELLSADGPILAGTADWSECSVVMQIPDAATRVLVRYSLEGTGRVSSDGFKVEIVGADVPETRRPNRNMTRNGDDR